MNTLQKFQPSPDLPAPGSSIPLVVWLRRNFFNSPFSMIVTAISLYLIFLYLPGILNWGIFNANWSGTTRQVCDANPDGACWTALKVRINQVLFGLYYGANTGEIWRPLLAFSLLVMLVLPLFTNLISRSGKYKLAFLILTVFPFVAFALIEGSWVGLPVAPTSQWGGFMLTFILASAGIVASLPIGIALALGRRSKMPAIKWLSIAFIEFWRANPLITILFMASNLLPLFFPAEIEFDKVARALVAITLFQSAYTAEAIRGGLAAVPRGQFEAADALGMHFGQKTCLIILPQALRISIPGIMNSFIELFKDTTLVSIIGLLDLFRMAQTVGRSIEWKGFDFETYIFSALVFFMCCYAMSSFSRRLEEKLDTDQKSE